MMSLRNPTIMHRSRRDKDERGATMVEMTLVMPFLILIVFGMLEMGMAWRNTITVTSASRQGARVASHLGISEFSDQEGILAVQAVFGDEIDQVEMVIIFDAVGDGKVPPACLTGSQNAGSTKCNTYTKAMIAVADVDDNWEYGGGLFDSTWPPGSRDNGLRTAGHLGVHIVYEHEYFTGMLPGEAPDIQRATVMRIEPEAGA